MSADANKRMYRLILRSLLRQSREMQKQNRNLWLQRFPSISEFQTTHFTETAIEIPSLINTFPKCFRELLHVNVGSREIDGAELARITKTIYRANPFADSTDETSNLSDAIECLKLVNAQVCHVNWYLISCENTYLYRFSCI